MATVDPHTGRERSWGCGRGRAVAGTARIVSHSRAAEGLAREFIFSRRACSVLHNSSLQWWAGFCKFPGMGRRSIGLLMLFVQCPKRHSGSFCSTFPEDRICCLHWKVPTTGPRKGVAPDLFGRALHFDQLREAAEPSDKPEWPSKDTEMECRESLALGGKRSVHRTSCKPLWTTLRCFGRSANKP